jgi:hypothetical protein
MEVPKRVVRIPRARPTEVSKETVEIPRSTEPSKKTVETSRSPQVSRRNVRPITRPPNRTAFVDIPDDVIKEMLSNMTCLNLQRLKIKNPAFSKFITLDLLNRSINLGYPRPEGKAKLYKMKIDIELPELQYYNQLYNLTNRNISLAKKEKEKIIAQFNKSFPNLYGKIDDSDLFRYQDKGYNLVLLNELTVRLIVDLFNNYTIEAPNDIVKGDIITVNYYELDYLNIVDNELEVEMIYDGACKFIQLKRSKLPLQFRVLEDNIPMKYWISDTEQYIFPYVNIDLRDKLEEIKNNMKPGQFGKTSSLAGYKLTFIPGDAEDVISGKYDIGVFTYSRVLNAFQFKEGISNYF